MRLKKHLQRWLLPAGVALLAFCAAAKLHELILSRAAMRRFEDLRQPTANNGAKQNPAAQPVVSLQILFGGRSNGSSTTKRV